MAVDTREHRNVTREMLRRFSRASKSYSRDALELLVSIETLLARCSGASREHRKVTREMLWSFSRDALELLARCPGASREMPWSYSRNALETADRAFAPEVVTRPPA